MSSVEKSISSESLQGQVKSEMYLNLKLINS